MVLVVLAAGLFLMLFLHCIFPIEEENNSRPDYFNFEHNVLHF